jgi:hypothetical protein
MKLYKALLFIHAIVAFLNLLSFVNILVSNYGNMSVSNYSISMLNIMNIVCFFIVLIHFLKNKKGKTK